MICIGPILVDLFWNTTFILLYLSRFLSWLLAWHWRGMGGIFGFTIIIIVTLDVGEGYMSSFILYLPLIQSYIQDSTSIKSFLFTKYLRKKCSKLQYSHRFREEGEQKSSKIIFAKFHLSVKRGFGRCQHFQLFRSAASVFDEVGKGNLEIWKIEIDQTDIIVANLCRSGWELGILLYYYYRMSNDIISHLWLRGLEPVISIVAFLIFLINFLAMVLIVIIIKSY